MAAATDPQGAPRLPRRAARTLRALARTPGTSPSHTPPTMMDLMEIRLDFSDFFSCLLNSKSLTYQHSGF